MDAILIAGYLPIVFILVLSLYLLYKAASMMWGEFT
jgi:hypothetical protein